MAALILVVGVSFLPSVWAEPRKPLATATPETIQSNLKRLYPQNQIHDAAVELRGFEVHPEFEVTLFASAPWVVNPIAMAWDTQNRLWVLNCPTYPRPLPGQQPLDFISVLEDTTGTGKADKCTIFCGQLSLPTGLALGDGGAYVAQAPDLLHLKDTGGGLRANNKTVLFSGFGSEDMRGAIRALRWGPGGCLFFSSGASLHSRIETPHGLVRLDGSGTFRLKPRSHRLERFNVGTGERPSGIAFNEWGQCFLADAAQGGIWHLNPGNTHSPSGKPVPHGDSAKAHGMEFLASQHFGPGFQDTLGLAAAESKVIRLYQSRDAGAGYTFQEIEPPLVRSSEAHFRPVDLKLGPDGALYIADFFQEVLDDATVSIRDSRRDHLNGRVWRITQKGRPILNRVNLNGLPLGELLDHLKSPNALERQLTGRILTGREGAAVENALASYVKRLDTADPRDEHHKLEALWCYQAIGATEPPLLRELLNSPMPDARAAACRILRDWLPQFPDAAAILRQRVIDPNPRVRMEALVTMSYLPSAKLSEAAEAASKLPMDATLDYVITQISSAAASRER